MTAPGGRARWGGLAVAVALAVSGCGSVSDDAQNRSLRALVQPVAAPAELAAPAPPRPCAREFDSRKATPLPPPGRMAPGSHMERIQQRGTLRVGVDQNTLGLGYLDPRGGGMQGLDIDLVRAVARAIFARRGDDRIVFTAISTAQRDAAIEDDKVDLVASAFSITCKRRRSMLFSSVYLLAQQKLLVPEDSPVDSLADLRGKRVCATNSSTSIGNLFGTGVVPYPVKLRPDCLVELQEGRVAAISADDSILFGFGKQDRQTRIRGSCINIERYGMAINPTHPEFVGFVNGVLERLGPDGLKRIRERRLPGLQAPTSAEIRRCDRRHAAHVAERRGEEHRMALGRRLWRGGLSAPALAQLYLCERACTRGTRGAPP